MVGVFFNMSLNFTVYHNYIRRRDNGRQGMVNKIVSEDYADIIIENRLLESNVPTYEAILINSRYSMVNVPVRLINRCSIEQYGYQAFPFCYTTQASLSLNASKITDVQRNPSLGMRGQGTLIAVIDTGINYLHEAFIRPDKTSKIFSIWDQSINNQESQANEMGYGTIYNREMINVAIKSEVPLEIVPTIDDTGHGTAVAGIIAGNLNMNENFSGVVPDAELIIVKLKQAKKISKEMFCIPEDSVCYQETDMLFALNYVIKQANILKKPLSICIAVGTNQGSHDGRGILSSYLSELSNQAGISIAIAAGNEGLSRSHYFGMLNPSVEFSEFQVRVGKNEPGFSMEIWKTSPYKVSVDITSPSGEYIAQVYPTLRDCRVFTFIFEPTTVWVNNSISEGITGDQLILIRFLLPTEGLWRFRIYNLDKETSDFHVWLPTSGLITDETYFINPNPDTTITSPGNSVFATTLTAYNVDTNSIYNNASRGLTRTGLLKPELAAPGVDIVCPTINSNTSYGTITGTGAAAAHVAGVNAMLLEWGILKGNNTGIDGVEIRSMLIRGAERNPDQSINNIWGYGKVDVLGVFEALSR